MYAPNQNGHSQIPSYGFGMQQPSYPAPPPGYPPVATYHQPYPPVVVQPTAGFPGQNVPSPPMGTDWMTVPQSIPANCPPGLEYLTTLDHLFVKQKVELIEAFIGFETNNKYTIKNRNGQKLYYAVEDTDCCTRNCCGSYRPFDMKVLDSYKNEIIHFYRELACDTCWFPCCLQKLQVFSPPNQLAGTVEQTWSILQPEFNIKDERGQTVLKIVGPMCRYAICGPVEFKVLSKDKSVVVGKISKNWSGLAREFFTDADYFGISFPQDLDVRMKAVMLGACFLIVNN